MTKNGIGIDTEETKACSATPLIVAYDISEDRRRNRLHRLLRGFGEPVQKSMFMCWVDAARHRRLLHLIEDFSHAAHKGQERIDCIPVRSNGMAVNASTPDSTGWIVE